MNRYERRHTKTSTGKVLNTRPMIEAGPRDADTPSTRSVLSVCRSCTRSREVFVPARICGPCIEKAVVEAQRSSDAALLEALEAETSNDDEESEAS